MKNIIAAILFSFTLPSIVLSQETWVEQNSGVSSPLTSVSAAGTNTGWVCGFNGMVLRTTNGGNNWLYASGSGMPASCQLTNIFAIDNLTAIASGNQGTTSRVFRTSNGGSSWTEVFSQPDGYIETVWMKDAQNGFMQGDAVNKRWSLWKTTNGGVNWDSSGLYLSNTFTDEYGWNNSMYVFNNNIWFGTTNYKIHYSSNYGASWTSQSSRNITVFSICMNPPTYTTGYACGPEVMRTTNGGMNWADVTAPGTGFYGGITASQTSVYYARGNNIYVSTNSGSTWSIQYTAPAGNYRHISERSVNGNNFTQCWAVRDNGGISRWQLPVSVETNSESVPDKFELLQNYPNPFNPKTNFEFRIVNFGFVTLKVFDLLGKEVTTLVNEEMKPGSYERTFNAEGLASGMYLYRLQSGTKTQLKKLLLMK